MDRKVLIRSMTTQVLEVVSPDEALLSPTYSPDARSDGAAATGPRGFGAETVIVLLLPYLYRFFEKMVDRIANRAGNAVADLIKRWLEGPNSSLGPEVEATVRDHLRQAGLSEEQASAVTPTVLKTLAVHGKQLLNSA